MDSIWTQENLYGSDWIGLEKSLDRTRTQMSTVKKIWIGFGHDKVQSSPSHLHPYQKCLNQTIKKMEWILILFQPISKCPTKHPLIEIEMKLKI